MFLDVTPERPVYIRGEKAEIAISARYAFGRPVPGLPVRVVVRGTVSGQRSTVFVKTKLTTDDSGRAVVTVPTHPGPDMTLHVLVEAVDATRRRYVAEAAVPVAATGYRPTLTLSRDVLHAGEEVRLTVRTADLLGNPVPARGRVEVGRAAPGSGTAAWDIVARLPIETKEGVARIVWTPKVEGRYRFLFRGRDRADREVTGAAPVLTVRAQSNDRIRVRAERPSPPFDSARGLAPETRPGSGTADCAPAPGASQSPQCRRPGLPRGPRRASTLRTSGPTTHWPRSGGRNLSGARSARWGRATQTPPHPRGKTKRGIR